MISSFNMGNLMTSQTGRGIEEHQLQTCADDFVDAFRELLLKHVNIAKSNDVVQRAQALQEVDVILDRMRDEARDMVDAYLNELT